MTFRAFLLVGLVCALSVATAQAVPINGLAAMGASETQGTLHSGSWVPYLAVDRGLNFGPSQSYNKAIGGSKSQDLLDAGQHTKVAALVAEGKVDVAYLFVGGLDVPPVALQLILGTIDVPTWANGIVSRIMTAVDTVLAENPQGMIVSGLPDMSLVPGAASYADFAQPVVDAIDYTNALLKAEVLSRNLVYIDTASAMRDLRAAPFVVGGVTINMTTGNPNPTHFFSDNIHPGTVGNGFFANMMLTALNIGYDTEIDQFSDQEILARAGLSGSYTGETSNVDYSKYIYVNVVPEPATLAQAVISVAAITTFHLVRRRRR